MRGGEGRGGEGRGGEGRGGEGRGNSRPRFTHGIQYEYSYGLGRGHTVSQRYLLQDSNIPT